MGADATKHQASRTVALYTAACRNDTAAIMRLVDARADPNHVVCLNTPLEDTRNMSAYMWCTRHGNVAAMRHIEQRARDLPTTPTKPRQPAAPCTPTASAAPCTPTAPAAPCTPTASAAPCTPTASAAPCTPTVPTGRVEETVSFKNATCEPPLLDDDTMAYIWLGPQNIACLDDIDSPEGTLRPGDESKSFRGLVQDRLGL